MQTGVFDRMYKRAIQYVKEGGKLDCFDKETDKPLYVILTVFNTIIKNNKDYTLKEVAEFFKNKIDTPDLCIVKPLNELLEDYSLFKDNFKASDVTPRGQLKNRSLLVDENHRDVILYMFYNIFKDGDCYSDLEFEIKEFQDAIKENGTENNRITDLLTYAFSFYGLTIGILLSGAILNILGLYDGGEINTSEQ
jgi:hypothetical protein